MVCIWPGGRSLFTLGNLVEQPLVLIGLGVIFDIYITEKVHWHSGKRKIHRMEGKPKWSNGLMRSFLQLLQLPLSACFLLKLIQFQPHQWKNR